MNAAVRMLRDEDCAQIHERSLDLLRRTGVRVMSERARLLFSKAGAEVESGLERIRLPRTIIEHALRQTSRKFSLGTRRPGPDLSMNTGECWLCADGGAVSVLDWDTHDLRPGTFEDWLTATQLIDRLDEIEIYWNMIEGGFRETPAGFVEYWTHLLGNCSKHIQDSVSTVEKARLLLEILAIAFGGRQQVRLKHPFSYVLCPMSPLVIDSQYTDAFLETAGWDLPVAIMPMPLMGATAPGSLLSTILVANADFLASLCLVQAASPGAPIIYAAMPAVMEPHTWRYTGGGVENSLLAVAAAQMARYYGLPSEIAAGGTDHFLPGTQASYERGTNWVLPTVAWPDVLVGPGLLGGSTILSLEQMMIDVEIFRRCKRLRSGVSMDDGQWLDAILAEQGPGGSFVAQKSTLRSLRDGSLFVSRLGFHGPPGNWNAAGTSGADGQLRDTIQDLLKGAQLPLLDPAIKKELETLALRVKKPDA